MTAGATILGCAGPRLGAEERAFFARADPWGFILFARNVETPAQLRRLTADLRDAVGRDAPVLIDQEGGRVQRLGPPHWRDWPPPLDAVRRAGTAAARVLHLRYAIIAAELRAVGIDADCAPVADIAGEHTHPFLKNRCYGSDVATVTTMARAVSDGLLEGGVLPVLKHIPGHGRARVDSHGELPVVDTDADTLRATDFAAFSALADLPMAMTAHVVYSALDPAAPATTSRPMVGLIRGGIGFRGLLMSDDIAMGALSGPPGARSRAAINAGCDVVLHCNGDLSEMEEVAEAAGRLGAGAAARAEEALSARPVPPQVDIAALEAELDGWAHGETDG